MGTMSVSQFNAEQAQKEKAKEEMIKQRIVLANLKKSGDVARLHFLRDLDPMVTALYHYEFNQDDPTKTIRAICAREVDNPCQYCAQYKRNKKSDLKPSQFIALPVWVHSFTQAEDITADYREEDVDYRILFLRRTADTVAQLRDYYAATGSICGCDWQYKRTGVGRDDTKYTLTPLPYEPLPLKPGVTEVDADDVMTSLMEAYPVVVSRIG